jgi:pimeloyl-ACP methyl ester carboxylesterase
MTGLLEIDAREAVIERDQARLLGERVAFAIVEPAARETDLPVVYVHGLGSDLSDLLGVARRVPAPGALLDLPGFGRSERVDRAFPVARAAETVVALMDRLGWSRAAICGASYGGHVALRLALELPRKVAALALVSSGGLFPDPPMHLAPLFEERLMAARPPAAVLASIDALVGKPCVATARFRARRLASHLLGAVPGAGLALEVCAGLGVEPVVDAPAPDYVAVARSARGALEDDAGRRLEQVAAPVELVHATRDPLVPLALAEAAADRLPRAGLTVLEGHGHMPWLEAPDAVAARVARAAALGR